MDYNKLVENLNTANNVRQETEESLKRIEKDNELLVMKLKNEIENHNNAKRELEKTSIRLIAAEKSNDELEIKTESISKQG